MKRLFALGLLMVAGQTLAGNYATCLLDKLPGTTNDVGAHATLQICLSKYPSGLVTVEQGSGRGLFSFSNGPECTAKKTSDTRSNRAAMLIAVACKRLYDEPNPFDQFEPSSAKPEK